MQASSFSVLSQILFLLLAPSLVTIFLVCLSKICCPSTNYAKKSINVFGRLCPDKRCAVADISASAGISQWSRPHHSRWVVHTWWGAVRIAGGGVLRPHGRKFRWTSTSLNTLPVKCKKNKMYDCSEDGNENNCHSSFSVCNTRPRRDRDGQPSRPRYYVSLICNTRLEWSESASASATERLSADTQKKACGRVTICTWFRSTTLNLITNYVIYQCIVPQLISDTLSWTCYNDEHDEAMRCEANEATDDTQCMWFTRDKTEKRHILHFSLLNEDNKVTATLSS